MIVVARYNEDLSWVKNINIPYVIYNKGSFLLEEYSNIKNIPNIGRESHTYISFIIENYFDLPENIIFCQGNPFPHCHNFLELIGSYQSNQNIINLSHWIVTEDLEGRPYAYGYGMVDMLKTLNIPFNGNNFTFPAGAQFIVNKNFIINKSKEWWEYTLEVHNSNELSPWIFERIWHIIFHYKQI